MPVAFRFRALKIGEYSVAIIPRWIKRKFSVLCISVIMWVAVVIVILKSSTQQTLDRDRDFTQHDGGQSFTQHDVGQPFEYKLEVDFRIIVLTFNRPASLLQLLRSLDELELDGDDGSLEIWIDRDKLQRIDKETLNVSRAFKWKQGPTHVVVQRSHAGIYGQWIESWRPAGGKSKELAMILEDDMNVSKYAYRWLKMVHQFYGSYDSFAGATLQSESVVAHAGPPYDIRVDRNQVVYMFKCIGTWGFSPHPPLWRDFQDWYYIHRNKSDFHPYVPGTVSTSWYKIFEKRGKADSMWSIWFTYFIYQKKRFSVYNNLNAFNKNTKSCLSVNRKESGLHYKKNLDQSKCELLSNWREEFVSFPNNIKKIDWNGKEIAVY